MKTGLSKIWAGVAVILVVFFYASTAAADASGGGSTAMSVSASVHHAGEISSTLNQLTGVLEAYGNETDSVRKKKLFEQAEELFETLMAQAKDVESEISTLKKKKLDAVYVQKLDRVLGLIGEMKTIAQTKMKEAAAQG